MDAEFTMNLWIHDDLLVHILFLDLQWVSRLTIGFQIHDDLPSPITSFSHVWSLLAQVQQFVVNSCTVSENILYGLRNNPNPNCSQMDQFQTKSYDFHQHMFLDLEQVLVINNSCGASGAGAASHKAKRFTAPR